MFGVTNGILQGTGTEVFRTPKSGTNGILNHGPSVTKLVM